MFKLLKETFLYMLECKITNIKEKKKIFKIVKCPCCGWIGCDNYYVCPRCSWENDGTTKGFSQVNKATIEECELKCFHSKFI